MNKITIAITTYNRSNMIAQCLLNIGTHPDVEEIIICDDHSEDILELRKQVRLCAEKLPNRILLIENEKNVGSFYNKVRAVGHCRKGWVCLLDSDNILDETYLQRAIQLIGKNTFGESPIDSVFMPAVAFPQFKFELPKEMPCITKENVKQFLYDNPLGPPLLNTGNFCFHTDLFNKAMQFANTDPHGACSIYLNYLFLKAGASLYLADDMIYFHRMHDGSHWLKTMDASQAFTKTLLAEMNTW